MPIARPFPVVSILTIVGGFLVLMSLGDPAFAQAPGADELPARARLGDPVFVTPESQRRADGPTIFPPLAGEAIRASNEAIRGSKVLDPAFKEPTAHVSRLAPQPTTFPQAFAAPEVSPAQPVASFDDSRARSGRFWVEADYLLWWMRGDSLPPLVTTSPLGSPRAQAGVLGAPGTSILFGNSTDSGQALSGGSITFGYWLNCCQTCGVEVNFFMLSSQANDFSAASNGQTILARPFFDTTTGQQSSQLISFPGVVSGGIGISDTSSLLGAGAWARHCLCANPCACNPYRLDWLVGFRYLRLRDDLSIGENLTSTVDNNGIPAGTTFGVSDRFTTTNNFYGLDLGLRGEIQRGRWFLSAFAHVALGATCEEVDISGSTRVTVPGGAPVVNQGGLLALQSNIGHFNQTHFAAVPEIGVKLGYQLTPNLRVQAGYNFLYWSNVARPGQQIDTSINPNLLPPIAGPIAGPLHPAANFQGTSFWATGLSLGILFNF